MKKIRKNWLSRREVLKAAATAPIAAGLTGVAPASLMLEPTPEIPDDDEPTPSQTEGPYFKPKSPERKALRDKESKGEALAVSGKVLFTDGKPVKGALLDFWQCDGEGVYDNEGFKLRGHQYTDADGRFGLETVFPGLYPGRTRHIHVKVQAPGGRVLTTQMYFPGEPKNRADGIFDERLLVKMSEAKTGMRADFIFVLRAT